MFFSNEVCAVLLMNRHNPRETGLLKSVWEGSVIQDIFVKVVIWLSLFQLNLCDVTVYVAADVALLDPAVEWGYPYHSSGNKVIEQIREKTPYIKPDVLDEWLRLVDKCTLL